MKKMYSTVEAAKILNISRIQVFRKIQNNQIKAQKVGRNFVIKHEDLLEALGRKIGSVKKGKIQEAVRRAVKEYSITFKKLAEE